jgi:glycosyltransferase involved in cell wall biosynthesis
MNPKNILYIEINTDGTIGGSHYCLYEMVKYLDRDMFTPSVIFFQYNPLVPDFQKICEVNIWKMDTGLILERDFPSFYKFIKTINILRKTALVFQKAYNFIMDYVPNLVAIFRYIKKNNIDLVHANNSPDLTDWLIVSKLLNVKVVSHLRFPWGPTAARRVIFNFYDKVISISDFVATQLTAKGVSRKNVVTIHDGIDVDMLEEKHVPSVDTLIEFKIPPCVPLIGVIGNIRRWKGQYVAIESMRYLVDKYSNIRCLIVGDISNSENDSEYLKYLKDITSKYGLESNIIFTGYRKDVLNILSQVDILVHTSVFPEPMGRVILEGMIFRKPVIATNHGGPVEIIEDGISGFLVEPGNPKALADKITFLLENREIAGRIGENARSRVEETFGIAGNVKKIEDVYETLFKGA